MCVVANGDSFSVWSICHRKKRWKKKSENENEKKTEHKSSYSHCNLYFTQCICACVFVFVRVWKMTLRHAINHFQFALNILCAFNPPYYDIQSLTDASQLPPRFFCSWLLEPIFSVWHCFAENFLITQIFNWPTEKKTPMKSVNSGLNAFIKFSFDLTAILLLINFHFRCTKNENFRQRVKKMNNKIHDISISIRTLFSSNSLQHFLDN